MRTLGGGALGTHDSRRDPMGEDAELSLASLAGPSSAPGVSEHEALVASWAPQKVHDPCPLPALLRSNQVAT
jgi:hypothetical protein